MSLLHKNTLVVILILGALSTVSPFAIDMYLPAFPQIAGALHTIAAQISLSVSSYFIGLALGQVFYGPLLDRFGRKKPLYVGLVIFILASIGCMFAQNIETLIVFRFVQALGGCAAQVGSMAMVRDFFPVEENARVISLLILILSVSPLLAPTGGGFLVGYWGWQAVFITLAVITALILAATIMFLPRGHRPDPTVSLKPWPIMRGFYDIFKNPQFYTFAMSGAFAFAGLFVYVAGAPIIFMEVFHVSAHTFSGIFAFLSLGFIGASQINVILGRRFRPETVFRTAIYCQAIFGAVFLIGTYNHWYGLYATIALFFLNLACVGIIYPNAAALALTPFGEQAGRAAALLGFLQMGVGALASTGVGLLNSHEALPAIAVLVVAAFIGFVIYTWGKRQIPALAAISPENAAAIPTH